MWLRDPLEDLEPSSDQDLECEQKAPGFCVETPCQRCTGIPRALSQEVAGGCHGPDGDGWNQLSDGRLFTEGGTYRICQ